jgi:hypothetical protein
LLAEIINRKLEKHHGRVALPKPGQPLPTITNTKETNTTENQTQYELEKPLIQELHQLRNEAQQTFKTVKLTTEDPTPQEIAQGLKNLSVGYRQETNIINKLKLLQNQTDNPYKRQDLPPFIDRTTLYPSKTELERTTKFGKSNSNKSFTVTPDKGALAQVLLPILKSGFLDQFNIWNLQKINIYFDIFIKGYQHTHNVDFRILKKPNTAWQSTTINDQMMYLQMAALYHSTTWTSLRFNAIVAGTTQATTDAG